MFAHFALLLVLDLSFYPKGRQHMLSYLPSRESGSVIGVYFAYEAILWFVFMWVNLFEFAMQMYFMKSIIRWSRILP